MSSSSVPLCCRLPIGSCTVQVLSYCYRTGTSKSFRYYNISWISRTTHTQCTKTEYVTTVSSPYESSPRMTCASSLCVCAVVDCVSFSRSSAISTSSSSISRWI